MKFQDNNGREVVLGPTHEESVTAMMEAASLSHRQLPQRLYQVYVSKMLWMVVSILNRMMCSDLN